MTQPSPQLVVQHVTKALSINAVDRDRMELIDDYIHGNHRRPYMPDGANNEYRMLADRCVTNLCDLAVNTPAAALYVDNYRADGNRSITTERSFQMDHWQESRLDQRQSSIYHAALSYGHSYTLTEKRTGSKVLTTGLSPLRTVVLYGDPSMDMDPVAAVYIHKSPVGNDQPGEYWYWNDTHKAVVQSSRDGKLFVKDIRPHGARECPVTPFYPWRDLDGRSWGVVEPLIPLQDRINQTIFDLLVAQTYTSFEVRTVTGMAPPLRMRKDVDGVLTPELDGDGNPIPDRQHLNASRWFYAEDPDVKFGSLPGGNLHGFIEGVESAIRHLSAIGQVPPHFLLGQIANVSAEALEAAETGLLRRVEHFRHQFGESWERVFRVAAQIEGNTEAADDLSGEVLWRDMGASSMAQSADALGKLAESLDIPKRALWTRVPGVTAGEASEWARIRDEDDSEMRLQREMFGRATTTGGAASGNTATPSTEAQPARVPLR